MSDSLPTVTDAEMAILQQLWDTPACTVRELTVQLYEEPSASNIATVQKLLQRLESKQLVSRDRQAHAHQFSAIISKTTLAGAQLEQLAARLTGGSIVPFLSHFVEGQRLSSSEREEIRKLLGDA